jgi:hypothetical protein
MRTARAEDLSMLVRIATVAALPLAACVPSDKDTADTNWTGDTDTAGDTDTGVDTHTGEDTDTGPPPSDLCKAADAVNGDVPDGGWSGEGESVTLDAATTGVYSDGCYGGFVEPPFLAADGAFDWAARIYPSGGGPEPRDMRAVGCVTAQWMDLSIVELDGAAFWGPWRMERDEALKHISLCD